MTANRKKGDMILWSGAVILIGTVVLAVLILLGVIQPNIFPMTGGILDINSLSSVCRNSRFRFWSEISKR
ncbi:MAG: hypothetical protein ACTSQI_03885 [Candidatus Helarchaeota archaeon]